ncbi:helix-turn-helix transcriptional regulator (plasmid) [Candidatus Bandiella numerosa]|uniref:helix-turn-helix domain-containing protein n=1 Tax=Candidatus Bandiella numerosa TaxID=2570586 RepID=UPI00249DE843|nr:helix-turn-helix transcriptional regulator [Candidatus Bandiella numerosa]WHA05645.1 helix-turn-helix transcriptional regulator [Candidatus Bandiella numerosa]
MEKNKFTYNGALFRENILKNMGLQNHKHLNKAQFAEKAGLQHDVIKKVTTGGIENPGIKTVAAIAQAIGCSIDTLIGYAPKDNNFNNKLVSAELPLNRPLFDAILIHIYIYLEKNNISANLRQLLHCIDSIYDYSARREANSPDINFTNWVLDSTFS